MRLLKPFIILLLSISLLSMLSFDKDSETPSDLVLKYYDAQLDTLINTVGTMDKGLAFMDKPKIKRAYSQSRQYFKRISFLTQYMDGRAYRLLNGPDLLKIDRENPRDSMKPHGFQVMERCIYQTSIIDKKTLKDECRYMIALLRQLRSSPDHQYQFTDANIWTALRTGVYGIMTLDITSFDAPLSKLGLKGCIAQLESMGQVIQFYGDHEKGGINTTGISRMIQPGIKRLQAAKSFNQFDRLAFIKGLLIPLSSEIFQVARQHNFYNANEQSPLNNYEWNLFSPYIFDWSFFSPNTDFRPTPKRIALGKILFRDVRLSGNKTRSCASCHKPEMAFTDGLAKPLAIDGTSLLRNTPTLFNSVFQTRQFFDMRTDKLENQLSDVVHNKGEMGGSLKDAVVWLKQDSMYFQAFKAAYPDVVHPISSYHIANAISSYVRSLESFDSPFDKFIREGSDDYPEAAKRGFNLFMGKAACGTCHYAPLFNGLVPPLYGETEAEALGVPASTKKHASIDADSGLAQYTRLSIHKYLFKTPTLRNISLTAPYMHNGVFKTLEEVVDFYNDGGGEGRGMVSPNQTLPSKKLGLSKREKRDLIVFLGTLTDTASCKN